MKPASTDTWPTVVAGLGSPHRDDQAGWRLIEMLKRRADIPARLVALHEATQLVDALDGCRRLIVVDACKSGGELGSVTRVRWPDTNGAERRHRSTHGMDLFAALRLADRLGRLPIQVDVFGIAVEDCSPGPEISPAVLTGIAQLERTILGELQEAAHA